MKRAVAILVTIVMVFSMISCRSDLEKSISRDMNSFADYISDNLLSDDIQICRTRCDEGGLYIELYGSEACSDILELIMVCNDWVDQNRDSTVLRENKKIRVELYNQKPDDNDRESSSYAVRLSNFGIDYATEPSSYMDVLDINICNEFHTSSLNQLSINYRVIMLPTNSVIDDFDVFMGMKNLEALVFSDDPYDSDEAQVERLTEELSIATSEYESIPFIYGIDAH